MTGKIVNNKNYVDTAEAIREQRTVSGFTRIKVSGDATLQVTQGDREWLIVEAPETLMAQVITEVVDGTLHLRLDGEAVRGFLKRRTIHFFVGCKALEAVTLSGATAARIPTLTTPELLCVASGAVLLEIHALETEHLKVKASGSATLTLAGHADQQTLICSGALTYHAKQLQSRQAQIEISGAAEMLLWVDELLDVRSATGASRIGYYGRPQVKQTRGLLNRLTALGAAPEQPQTQS